MQLRCDAPWPFALSTLHAGAERPTRAYVCYCVDARRRDRGAGPRARGRRDARDTRAQGIRRIPSKRAWSRVGRMCISICRWCSRVPLLFIILVVLLPAYVTRGLSAGLYHIVSAMHDGMCQRPSHSAGGKPSTAGVDIVSSYIVLVY